VSAAATVGTRLGPYEITARLGAGGMGEVWRATDARLGREVALKLLPRDMSADPDRVERFRREARAVAALNHPHIVTLHSIEEAEGTTFLTMELVDGEALDRLVAPPGLAVERVVEIGLAVADALAAAHAKGIVHRDLKPANVMLDAHGRVKVLDFGLAKAAMETTADPAAETRLDTREGILVGTLPYMSPEQLRGEPLDGRSDIFALGVLLHELVCGERPFQGASAAELSGAILRDPAPRLTQRRPGVPVELERILLRCLEKEPRDRFQSASALHDELRLLRRDASGASTGGVAAEPRAVAHEALAIAVLPFSDMSPQRDQEALCEGMAEEIMNALVGIAGLRVAARASAFRAKRDGNDVDAIARLLKVAIVLDGSVRTAGRRLRVTAQLVDAASGFSLWSERYDRDDDDLFAVQDEIAAAVVGAVRARLGISAASGGEAAAPARAALGNLDAYQTYLRARHLRYTRNDALGALRLYEEAVALDPACASAWVGMAEVHFVACFYSLEPVAHAKEQAQRALARATALLGETAEGNYVEGIGAFMEGRWSESERRLRRSVELDPHRTEPRCWLGTLLVVHRRVAEAAEQLDWARALDPLAAYPYGMSGMAELQARRVERALQLAEQGTALDPHHPLSLWVQGLALVALGRVAEAIAPLEHAASLHRTAFIQGALGWALARAGDRASAQAVLAKIAARGKDAPAVVSEAWVRAELDDLDGAWAVLDRCEAEGQFMLLLHNLPGFDRFWPEARFRALVARLGLPSELPAGMEAR
jgi:TolB-like protein/Flp pilus assembly protein TadD